MTRDDRADAERPERPDAGVLPQPTPLEIGGVGLRVRDAAGPIVARHEPPGERISRALERE